MRIFPPNTTVSSAFLKGPSPRHISPLIILMRSVPVRVSTEALQTTICMTLNIELSIVIRLSR